MKNENLWILNRESKIFVMKLGDQNTVFSCNCSVSYPQMKVFIFKKKNHSIILKYVFEDF